MADLLESIGHARGVRVDGRGTVRDRLGRHRIREGVLVAVLVVGSGIRNACGDGVAQIGGLAPGCDVVLQFVVRGKQHVLAVVRVAPQCRDVGGCGDAAADHVKRVVHAEHHAVVARFGGARHQFRAEFRQQRRQSKAAVVCLRGVARRECLRRLGHVGVVVAEFGAVFGEHREAHDIEFGLQPLQIIGAVEGAVPTLVVFRGVRTRIVEIGFRGAGADELRERGLAGIVEHQCVGLRQSARVEAFLHETCDGAAQGIREFAVRVIVDGVDAGALRLGVRAVRLHSILVILRGLVVDGHDGVVVLIENAHSGIGDIAAERRALRRVA